MDAPLKWLDLGQQCDHCSGKILERSSRNEDDWLATYKECQRCGCQWSLSDDLIRVGTEDSCEKQWWSDNNSRTMWRPPDWPTGVWVVIIGLGLILLFPPTRILLLRLAFTATALLRSVFSLIFIIAIGWFIYQLGKSTRWW